MLKKILQVLFKPNHRPEMVMEESARLDPFIWEEQDALLVDLINRFWVTNKTAHLHHSKAMIREVAEQLMEDCRKVITAENPVMLNRQLLADSVLKCAKLQVMTIVPFPEKDGSGLRGHLGISGELKAKIMDIVKTAPEFENFPQDADFDSALMRIQNAYRRAWVTMSIYERLRHEYDDFNHEQSEDWFRPFFASQCAYAEHYFREQLGMPMPSGTDDGVADGKKYGSYREIVLRGDQFPDQVWEAQFPGLTNPKTIWA